MTYHLSSLRCLHYRTISKKFTIKKKIKQLYHAKKNQKLPIWSLKDLYSSPNSKEIQKDLELINKECLRFEKKFLRKVLTCNAKQLYKGIIQLEKIDIKIDKILSSYLEPYYLKLIIAKKIILQILI